GSDVSARRNHSRTCNMGPPGDGAEATAGRGTDEAPPPARERGRRGLNPPSTFDGRTAHGKQELSENRCACSRPTAAARAGEAPGKKPRPSEAGGFPPPTVAARFRNRLRDGSDQGMSCRPATSN